MPRLNRRPAFTFFGSRHKRRSDRAIHRSRRTDVRWMRIFLDRQERQRRYRNAFRRFVPLNITRFRVAMGVLMGVLSNLFPQRPIRTRYSGLATRRGMISWGRR